MVDDFDDIFAFFIICAIIHLLGEYELKPLCKGNSKSANRTTPLRLCGFLLFAFTSSGRLFQVFLYVLQYIFVFLHLYLNVDMNDLVRFESLPEVQSPEEAEEIIQQKE